MDAYHKSISALVVSGVEKGISFITELLDPALCHPVTVVRSGGEARRLLVTENYDLIVVDAPLPDEFGHELAIHISEKSRAGTILLVRSELMDEISYRVEDYGVLTVSKPISRAMFHQAFRMVTATRARMNHLENENDKLRQKIEELRLVDRAKAVLMEYLKMSESQAHRYIEKQAMDMRMTKRAVAEGILKTYLS